MKPFIVVDRFLLSRVEKLSHCLQKTFGLGCHKWAQLLYGGVIADIAIFDILPSVLKHKPNWLTIGCFPLYLICYLWLMPDIEKIRGELSHMGIANSSKINPVSRFFRLFQLAMFLTWVVTLRSDVVWTVNWLLIALSSYFSACDDLPPGKSRVRKFVDAIKAFGMKPVSVQQ